MTTVELFGGATHERLRMEFCWTFQFLLIEASRKVCSKCDVLCNLQTCKELTNGLLYLFHWKFEYLQLTVRPHHFSHWLNEFPHAHKYPIMLSFLFSFSRLYTCKNSFQTLRITRENISKTQLFYNYFYNSTKFRQFMKNSLLNEIVHYRKFLLRYSKNQISRGHVSYHTWKRHNFSL